MSWASAVPSRLSARIDAIASQLGTAVGSWKRASGAGTDRPSASSRRRAPDPSCPRPRVARTRPRSRTRATEDDGERAGDRKPAAARMDPGDDGDADDSDPEAQCAGAGQPLVREELQRDQRVEDRHRRLHDGSEAGVDVLLPPGDQPERDGRVERAEDQEVTPGQPCLGARSPPSRSARRHT